jgi:MFS family permease
MNLSQTIVPLRHKPFRLQFAARTISMIGTTLTPVAVAFGVLQTGGSATTLALVLGANSVTLLVFMLAGGVWADRLPRHRLMLASDLTRFATQTTFGLLLITEHNPLWAMMLLQAISGVAQAFHNPATIGLTAETAPAGFMQQANALIAVTGDITGIAGPLIAGTLTVTIGAGWAIAIDGLSFLGSAVLLSRLRLETPSRRSSDFLAQLREGWREVRHRDWLWSSICWFAVFNLTYAVLMVLGPSILARNPSGALVWGVIAAALSVGTLCGNALALRLMPHYLLRWARVAELIGVIPILVALAIGASEPLLIASAFLMGVVMAYPDVLWFTALQQEVPEESLSRVSAFDHLGSFTLRPVGYTIAAALIGTIAFGLLNLASLAVPGTRSLSRAAR